MAYVSLEDVSVQFPLYQAPARSFKRALLAATVGGSIGRTRRNDCLVVKGLADVSLHVREGDRLALVGHNGAGKTTLLRTMAGIYHPDRGKVMTDGTLVTLFDIHAGFDDEATGYENMLLRGLLLGFTRATIEQRMSRIAEFSGLGDFLNLPVRTYSAGMMVRLLFSIATSGPVDILLMDEWIAAGDQDFIEKANKRLHEYINEAKILVFASHNPELLRAICNRAVLLEAGRIVRDGSVDEILGAYSHRAGP